MLAGNASLAAHDPGRAWRRAARQCCGRDLRGARRPTSAAGSRPCQLPAGRHGRARLLDRQLPARFGTRDLFRLHDLPSGPVRSRSTTSPRPWTASAPKSASVQPVFVDMDPERGDPVNLRLYMQSFGSRFLGLTGSPKSVADAAKSFKVQVERLQFSADPTDYAMTHLSPIFVMRPGDPQPLSLPPDECARRPSRPHSRTPFKQKPL